LLWCETAGLDMVPETSAGVLFLVRPGPTVTTAEEHRVIEVGLDAVRDAARARRSVKQVDGSRTRRPLSNREPDRLHDRERVTAGEIESVLQCSLIRHVGQHRTAVESLLALRRGLTAMTSNLV
jgi:hypothetical protein